MLTLQTNRLLLRPLNPSDVEAFFVMNNNPNVNAYLRNPITTIQEAEKYVQKIINEYMQNGIGRYAVILKENNRLIGFSGLKFRTTEENGFSNFYDLGYRFAEEHWRKGLATEAAKAWLEYGFNEMNLSVIHACAVTDNVGSNAVLQKLGFEFTNQYYTNHEPHNWYTLKNKNHELNP